MVDTTYLERYNYSMSIRKNTSREELQRRKKISATMKKRGVDNFAKWRKENTKTYKPLKKDGDLAELIGIILGDGHIGALARTESLRIVGDAQKMGFVNRSADLVQKVFGKKPTIKQNPNTNTVTITIYEKHISNRIGIHTGAQGNRVLRVPRWILRQDEPARRYLRGLYEAEGSYSVHKPTYTYKFIFKNSNDSLLDIVERLVKRFGFHPHRSYRMVQLSRKKEVERLLNLLQYRVY